MKIFVSWSGADSRQAAELMRDWLPKVIQQAEVWVSSQDIGKGERWSPSLWQNLSEHNFGLLMVTKTNLTAPWVMFEAGALAKSVSSRVIPVLCNLSLIDVANTPLGQFQSVNASREEILDIVQAVANTSEKPMEQSRIEATFAKWWPDFEEAFSRIQFQATGMKPPKAASDDSARLERIESVLENMMKEFSRIREDRSLGPTGPSGPAVVAPPVVGVGRPLRMGSPRLFTANPAAFNPSRKRPDDPEKV